MTAGTKWLLAIVGLLAANVLAAVILIIAAHSGGQSKVLPAGGFDRLELAVFAGVQAPFWLTWIELASNAFPYASAQ